MKKLFLSVTLAIVSFWMNAQTINVSTSIDLGGNALPQYTADPHWQMSNLTTPMAYACNGLVGIWNPQPVSGTQAGWINNTGYSSSAQPGIHTFERSFNVPAGNTQFTCNFSVACDDQILSVELVRPDLSTIPLTVIPTTTYHLSAPITDVISTVGQSGVWKLRVTSDFIDNIAAFMCSGFITLPNTSVCLNPTEDAMIHEFVPTTNYGSSPALVASRWTYDALGGTGFYTTKTLHKYDFSGIPSGATILSATLTQHVCTTCNSSVDSHKDLSGLGNAGLIERVNSTWNEGTVTWATAPGITGSAITIPSPGNASTADLISDVTSLVQAIVSSGVNHGFQISVADNSDYYHSIVYASRENTDATLRPELCITYTLSNPCNTTVTTTGSGCGTTACPYVCIGSPSGGTFSGPSGLNTTTGVYIGSIPTSGVPYTYTYTAGSCTYTVNGTITKPVAASLVPPTLTAYTGPTASGAQVVVTWPSTGNVCGEWYEFAVTNASGMPLCTVSSIAPSNTFPFPYTPLAAGTSGKIIQCSGMVVGQNYCVKMRVNRCGVFGPWSTTCQIVPAARAGQSPSENASIGKAVALYPNPTQDKITVDMISTLGAEVSIQVLDATGRVVKEISQSSMEGRTRMEVNLLTLPKGLYVARVMENGKQIHVQKFSKE